MNIIFTKYKSICKFFIIVFFLIIFVPLKFLNANESSFCLGEDGFIIPKFDLKCEENYTQINLNEFNFLAEILRKDRDVKLKEFRSKNKDKKVLETVENKNQSEILSKEISEKSKFNKVKEEKNFAKEKAIKDNLIKKSKLENERKIKLANDLKIQEKKKIEKAASLEKKELEKQARIQAKIKESNFKKEQTKKIKEDKNAEKIKNLEIENNKVTKLQELKNNTKVSKNQTTKENLIINDKTVNAKQKIILLDKKIVKNELFPNLISKENFDFQSLENLNKKDLDQIFNYNKNVILIIPKNFYSSSNVVSENNLISKIVTGKRSVPNPEFNRLQMEIRRAERELMRAQAEAERGFQMSQCMSCDLITRWGGVALQSRFQKEGAILQNQISSLINSYSTTPDLLDEEVLGNYNYIVENIEGKKEAIYKIFKYSNNKYFFQEFSLTENKNFQVSLNISPQDKSYDSLSKKYATKENVSNWGNSKIKDANLSEFLVNLESNNKFAETTSIKEVYNSIDNNSKKTESFWGKLFSSDSKNANKKLSVALQKNNSFSISDPRFVSVVIVQTEDGLGSGFYVKPDLVITNYHVVEKSKNITLIDQNNNKSSAIVLKKDLTRDLALLKTNTTSKPVSFYKGQVQQGSKVDALGHPQGRKFSIAQGIVSAVRMESSIYNATNESNVLYIQTDAAINPGNSGGPLFLGNEVVGINTQGLSKKQTEGMNFAVHFSEVLDFLK